MSNIDLEEFENVVALASRYVQTPEGADKFGQPIGTLITPDMIKKANAKAAKGKKASKEPGTYGTQYDPQTGKMKPGAKTSSPENYGSDTSSGMLPVPQPSKLSGPNSFKVGESTFSAPAGSKLIRPKTQPNMAYVLTPDGSVHAFNDSGEVPVPEYLDSLLKEKFSSLKGDDPLYSVEEFDAYTATSLKDQKPGAFLSLGGEKAFTKVDDSTWEHAVLGVAFTDDDLQSQFDSGKFELTPSEVSEDTNFSKMTADEIEALLESYPEGKVLGMKDFTLTKKDGNWKNTKTLNEPGLGVSSSGLAHTVEGTDWLSDKEGEPEDAPAVLKDPLQGESVGRTKDDKLTALASSEDHLIDPDDLISSFEGDFVFHKTQGALQKKVLGENEESEWESLSGLTFTEDEVMSSVEQGSISELPWTEKHAKAYDKYQIEKLKEVEQQEEESVDRSEAEPTIPSTAGPVSSLDEFETGDEIYINMDFMGTMKLKLDADGNWTSEADGSFTPEQLQGDLDNDLVWAEPKLKKEDAVEEVPEDDEFMKFIKSTKNSDIYSDKYYNAGKVDSVRELEKYPAGTVITADSPYNNQAYAKSSDGMWAILAADEVPYFFSSEDFQGEIESGELSFMKPAEEKAQTEEADPFKSFLNNYAEEEQKQESTTPKVTSSPSDEDSPISGISEADRKSAIEALESHSGFQVKYGLKSLPDTHPLKDPLNLEDELNAAKAAYPDLKPKQALLAYLKGEKPDTALADWEKELLEGDSVVQIGSFGSPKKVIQGLTGGTFTQKEVQDAINTLENYDGKLFKSALQKAGNPLGDLSPNDIIGFEKDKLVGKQKFIDFLKGKLEKVKAEEAPKNIDEAIENDPDGLLDPETPTSRTTPISSYTELLDYPIGSKIQVDVDGNLYEWTKTEEDKWVLDDGEGGQLTEKSSKFSSGINIGITSLVSLGEGASPKENSLKPGDKLPKDFKASEAPTGMVVKSFAGTEYTKTSDGWKSESVFSNQTLQDAFDYTYGKDTAYVVVSVPGAKSEEKPLTETDPKEVTLEQVKNAPVGTQAYHNGKTYLKEKENAWTMEGQVFTFPDSDMQKTLVADDGWSFKAPKEGTNDLPTNLEDLSSVELLSALESAKTGSQIQPENSDAVLTKKPNGYWNSDITGKDLSSEDLVPSAPFKVYGDGTNSDLPEAGTQIPDFETFKNLPIGTKTYFQGSYSDDPQYYYEKISDTIWMDTTSEVALPQGNFAAGVDKGNLYYADPSDAPNLPEETKSKLEVGDYVISVAQLDAMSPGESIKVMENIWVKNENGQMTEPSSGAFLDTFVFQATLDNPNNKVTYAGLHTPEEKEVVSPHGIEPGIYNTGKGAKAKLYINPDGTGVYAGMKGIKKPLNADEVKKNYDAGMSVFVDQLPPSGSPTADAPVATSKPKASVNDLEDGTYFVGVPGVGKTTIYSISGDTVKMVKPMSTFAGMKTGQKATKDFIDTAPEGAMIESNYLGYKAKKTNGKWELDGGGQVPETYLNGYWSNKWKIKSVGDGEPTEVKKSTLKTKFLQGKLLDSNGTSVLPTGYSGTFTFLGKETNPIDLLEASNSGMETWQISDQYPLFSKVKTKADPDGDMYAKDFFQLEVEKVLSGLDTTVPDVDTSKLFTLDALGHAEMPEALANITVKSYYEQNLSIFNAQVKEIAALFGDGTIIAQNPTSMSKVEKSNWISAVKKGDFKKAYQIELQAAASTGKSMPKGWEHPGYPTNTETHQVVWTAAVKGEIPAGGKVDGSWSSSNLEWSIDEINNYLIKAQMQNPTYLTPHEKRAWVKKHIEGDKSFTDKYSLIAQSRKNDGQNALSPEISWTDDIKPAKSYDSMFESTDYPTDWSGYGAKNKALDWLKDNADKYPEVKAEAQKYLKDNYGDQNTFDDYTESIQAYGAVHAVQQYFEQKKAEYEAELLKPVYTKEAGQTKGSHPGAFYTDQFGKKYYMKWWNTEDQLSNYRLEVEHAGNMIGRAFGFKTANSKLLKQDGHYGQMQDVVDGVGDLTGFDYSTISPQMLADIEGEHMLDWMLQNDDTKADNAIITPGGNIVGIDKARSFKDYGVVNWDHDAPDGNLSIYTRLYSAVKSGKISKETMDEAFLKINSTALRMQKMDNKKFFDLIDAGSANRPSWTINYKIDGKKVSQDVDGLKAAFADQKSKLHDKVVAEWTQLYKDAGLGDLPEPPTKQLGEGLISGFDDPELYENLAKTKTHGTATAVAGASVIGGHVLTWQDKTKGKDEVNLNGEFFLAPKAQEALLSLLASSATDLSGSKTETHYFSSQDDKWQDILAMAKTVNQHAADGQYNATTVSSFEALKKNIDAEIDQWTPNLESNTTSLGGLPAFKFSTGKTVPMEFVDQYKMMLDYYKPKVDEIWKSYEDKDKTPGNYEQYTALEIDKSSKKYLDVDAGESLTKMSDGKWLYNNGETLKMVTETASSIIREKGNWTTDSDDAPEEPQSAIKIVKLANTHEKQGDLVGDMKEVSYDSYGAVSGSAGQEYEITLATGEVIYFRNSGHTDTKRGQQGKVSFHARGKGGVDESSAAMQNIVSQLGNMGIELNASEQEDAELTYWREMYGILVNRNHDSSPAHKAALADMEAKRKEIGASENTFIEEISGKMSVTEQNEFWRAIWAKHFGQDRVDKLISEEGYLPKFDHQNYDNPEIGTGQPYWERLDITLEEIYKTQVLIGSSLGKEPTDLVKAGGSLGAEERLRQAENFDAGGSAWSAHSDQSKGSSHNIYTRLLTKAGSQNAYFSPKMLLRTRTYSFGSDTYGALDSRKNSAPSSVTTAINNFKGDGNSNETMLPHMATLLDSVEIYVFDDAKAREEMIQLLKSKGIEMIRGLPIEDRLVMRSNLNAAIAKVKATWTI